MNEMNRVKPLQQSLCLILTRFNIHSLSFLKSLVKNLFIIENS